MRLPKIDPITRRRLARFRRIKRGYYSLLILVGLTFLSLFSEYLANGKAVVVRYDGQWFFPTWSRLYTMEEFGQEDLGGFGLADIEEADYWRLQKEWRREKELYRAELAERGDTPAVREELASKYPNARNWVLMPPIPWGPFESDFWYNEVLDDLDMVYWDGLDVLAERAEREGLAGIAALARSGELDDLFDDPDKTATGSLVELARNGYLPGAEGLPATAPNAPDWSRKHFLGTDSQGRDVASRLIYGFRISIFFALALVITGQFIGSVIGSFQGYLGGRFDIASQRFIEIWMSMPFLYIVIIMAAIFSPNFWLLLGLLALFQWISITFYMRTEMYREKSREYCLAARSYGAGTARIIFRHLLPNCLTPLVTFTPFAIVGAIFSLTGLDYLGYGLPPPTPSWGELIDQALRPENRDKLWLTFAPFGAISVTLILVTFVGESVREAFDPKQFAKYE